MMFTNLSCSHCPCHPEPFSLGNYRNDDLEVVEGGMQDYGYLFSNCMELTVEVSCDKRPHSRTLATHWRNNYQAMMAMLRAVDGGVKGVVVDQGGTLVAGAMISVKGIDKDTITNERGEFWRLLLPGTYVIKASIKCDGGELESDPVSVMVTRELGEGAQIIKLVVLQQFGGSDQENKSLIACERFGQSG